MQKILINILMVEDNPDHACLAKYALESSKKSSVTIVPTSQQCFKAVEQNQYDIILLDYHLPNENGLTILKKLVNEKYTESPIVFVTGNGHTEIAVEAMKAGAFDYVIKSRDYYNVLPNVVTRVLEKFRIISEKKKMEAEIHLRNKELHVLNSVSVALNESLVLDEIIDTALFKILTELPVDAVAVLLREDGTERLMVQSVKGEFETIFQKDIVLNPAWKRLEQFVMIEQKIVVNWLIENSESPFAHDFLNGHLNSFISVPLVYKSEMFGTFLAASKSEDFFSERRVDLLSAIVNQMSIAVKNSQLYLDTNQYKNDLENLFNSSLDFIVTLSIDGVIQYKNERFDKVFGADKKVAGKKIVEFVAAKHKDKVKEKISVDSRDDTMYEIELMDAKGHTIPCLISQSTLNNRDEFLLIIKDVSQISQLQKQLIQAEKLSALGQMIAGAAHELNNPLAGILGYGQLILEEDLPQQTLSDVQVILKETDRCKTIVQNLLSFARKQNSVTEMIDINKMLTDIFELQRYDFEIRFVELVIDLEPTLPKIFGNCDQLQQVFLHLVRNAKDALKISSKHGKKLTVTTEKLQSSILVKIDDNGCGISPENKDKIFDPFFTTKEIGEGTGLGLSLCFGIVHGHEGQLSLEKSDENGSLFVVELPAFKAKKDKKFKVNNTKSLAARSQVSC